MAAFALRLAPGVISFMPVRRGPGLQLAMSTRNGHVRISLGVLGILSGLLWQYPVMAAGLAATGLISLFQVASWKPFASCHRPLLWILYVGYTFLGLGLVFAAVYLLDPTPGTLTRAATHVHIIGMGGFAILIIGMVTRTALGHLGRPLVLDRSMRAS